MAVAQIISGSDLWQIYADPQKANSEAINESLATNKAQDRFATEHKFVCELLNGLIDEAETISLTKNDWQRSNDLYGIFAKLIELDDEAVTRILTFVVAETLSCGTAMVEVLGNMLSVDMAEDWQVDDGFFDLLRDKQAINAILKQIGGRHVADGNITSTAKVQKQIIHDYLDGTRSGGKKDWQPRYMDFPIRTYTEHGGIQAIEGYNAIKEKFA